MSSPPLPSRDDRATAHRASEPAPPRAAGTAGAAADAADPALEPFARRVDQFARQIAAMRRQTAALRRHARAPLADVAAPPREAATPLPADVVDDLLAALESLQTAEEELYQQHEELGAAHAALDRERLRFRSLFDDAPVAYLVTGPDGMIRAANRAAAALLGVDAGELTRKPIAAYVAPDDRRTFRERLAAAARHGGGQVELAVTLVPRGGAPIEALVTGQAAPDPFDAGPAVRWVVRDVTAERAAEREVRRLNEELETRVAARTRDLAARTTELESASCEKTRFLATLSHEVRTPVTAIVGYADLLEAGIGGPLTPAQRTYVDRLRASTGHLLSLVEGVLDLAKVEAGRATLDARACPLHASVDDALAIVRPRADARGVCLEHACDGDDGLLAVADARRVRQILVNLLANAVRFTPEGGRVAVRCGLADEPPEGAGALGDGPWAWTAVADTGAGIPHASLAAVFEPFVQAGAGAEGGCGLGLTISRRLARLMGGDLLAESEPGRGSVFTLWLPTAGGPPADRAV